MEELKVMDDQKRAESLNRPREYNTTQYIVTQLGEEQYGIDMEFNLKGKTIQSRIDGVKKLLTEIGMQATNRTSSM